MGDKLPIGGEMRYVVAMLFAIAVAALAMLFVSGPIASWTVAKFAFDNPDQVGDMHTGVFMAVNVLTLVVGWLIGWALGGTLVKDGDGA